MTAALVNLSVGGEDFEGVLRFVQLLEDEPGFTDVRIETVGSQDDEDDGGVGDPLASPEEVVQDYPVNFTLTLIRTERLLPPDDEANLQVDLPTED